jgi:hypothetical protein
MHLNIFTEICDMIRIKDLEQDVVKLHVFTFSLRGEAKDWLVALPGGTMQLRSNIISFR